MRSDKVDAQQTVHSPLHDTEQEQRGDVERKLFRLCPRPISFFKLLCHVITDIVPNALIAIHHCFPRKGWLASPLLFKGYTTALNKKEKSLE